MAKGRPKLKNPRQHLVTVRITADEKETLMRTAENMGTSLSDLIRRILRACLESGVFKS